MLVLSRKTSESIKIGDAITIVVNRIAGNRVTLGIEAPRNMRIIRGELKPFDEPREAARPEPESEKVAAGKPMVQNDTAALTISIDPEGVFYAPRRAR